MGKYLKKFENHSAYEAAESSLILPNVSLCVSEGDVYYNPAPDPYNGHDYVDLGLPSGTKWATMNVGANSVTDYGNYYQYGKGAATYQETSGQTQYIGTENPLASSADTATQVWGGSWHMPTSAQCQELKENTTQEGVTIDGIYGVKFTAQNGNYIFVPASGYYKQRTTTVTDEGEWGSCHFWSSTPVDSYYAWFVSAGNDRCNILNNPPMRSGGNTVRPVVG